MIYGVILGALILSFPFWGIKKPTGVLDDPITGNPDLLYFATDAPDNILIYSPGERSVQLRLSASERIGDLAVSSDGRTIWSSTKSGFIDRYEIPLGGSTLLPTSSDHKRIAPVLSAIALSADGRFIAVGYGNIEDYNSRNIKILPADTLDVRGELADFSVSGDIQDIVANPVENIFYIINSHSDRVRIYNADRFRLESDIIELGNSPGRFVVRPDGKRAYGAMNARQSVTVVNLDTNEVQENIVIGFPPYAMCFNEDGSHLYVASRDSNVVAAVNTETNEIIKVFHFPPRIEGILEYNYAEMIGVSPAEDYIYVMPKRAELIVYDMSEVFDESVREPKLTMVQSEVLPTTPFFMSIVRGSPEANP
jgi:WD40 repeat protein